MQLKTFRAPDMREALRAVKQALGPDAMILSTREITQGDSVLGVFRRAMVEVTAAVDRADEQAMPAPRSRPQLGDSHSGLEKRTAFSDQIVAAAALQPLREDLAQLKEDMGYLRGLADRPSAESVQSLPVSAGFPSALASTYDRLLSRGLDWEAAWSVVREMEQALRPSSRARAQVAAQATSVAQAKAKPVAQAEALEAMLRDRLSRLVQVAGPLLEPSRHGKAVMLVGPTGVGKTTTIAKLAAQYALTQKRSVALITLDTYRVAAVEQLRVYADILKLPLDVALTCKDLTTFLRARQGADLILIDTAGRSPLDEVAIQEIAKSALARAVETHLVLSASTRETDMDEIVARFSAVPIQRLIFAKLDETTSFGAIFNVARRVGLPLSYLCVGQCVPDDLALATPRGMAAVLLDGLPVRRQTKASAGIPNGASVEYKTERQPEQEPSWIK